MTAPTHSPPLAAPKSGPGFWRTAWRIFYWFCIVAGAWTLVLMLRRAPAPQVSVSPQAARSAEKKLEGFAVAPAPSLTPAEPRRIALTEEELNSYLSTHLPLQGSAPGADPSVEQARSSVRDVKITLQGDRAGVFAVFNLAGKDLTLNLEGRLHVVNGYLRFEPTGGSLGELALPQAALDAAVSRILDNPDNRDALRVPAGIRDIRVENGELVIEYQ